MTAVVKNEKKTTKLAWDFFHSAVPISTKFFKNACIVAMRTHVSAAGTHFLWIMKLLRHRDKQALINSHSCLVSPTQQDRNIKLPYLAVCIYVHAHTNTHAHTHTREWTKVHMQAFETAHILASCAILQCCWVEQKRRCLFLFFEPLKFSLLSFHVTIV